MDQNVLEEVSETNIKKNCILKRICINMANESINSKLQARAERIKEFFAVDTSENDFSVEKPANTEDALKKIILPFVPTFRYKM